MQWLAKISVQRPVFAAVLILSLVVAGIFSFTKLGLNQFPDVDAPTITVTTTLAGSAPEEMDTTVTEEIEKQVNTASGIDHIASVSSEGTSVVTITFSQDKNVDTAFNEVQAKVNLALPNLPTNAKQPTVEKLSTDSAAILSFTLTAPGESIRSLSEYADKTLRPQLESVSGVGQANITGGQLRQINVALDPYRLHAYDLTAVDVKNALTAQNVEVPGGSLEQRDQNISVRTEGQFASAGALNSLVVAQHDGQPVLLGSVSRVTDAQVEATSLARLNGQNTVLVEVKRQSGSNTIAVIHALKAKLAQITLALPAGYRTQITRDQSTFIEASVSTIEEHLILGAVLAALVVLVFLWDWRSTLIASFSIPASIIAACILLWAKGFTLNTITLLALTLAIGIVIDDSILVLENISRFIKEKGKMPREAALEATQEIGLAVLATTLSLVAIFLPIVFLTGTLGKFLTSFGLTMAFAILISLLVAFTLVPMLTSRWLQPSAEAEPPAEDVSVHMLPAEDVSLTDPPEVAGKRGVYHHVETAYWYLLRWSLHHRWIIVVACLITLAAIVPLAQSVHTMFIPNDDQSQFIVSLRTPEGTSLQATSDLMEHVATEIRALPDVKFTLITAGNDAQQTASKGDILVQMAEISDRKSKETQFTLMQRVRTEVLPHYPQEIHSVVSSPDSIGGGSAQSDIQYIITGPDLAALSHASDQMVAGIKKIPGVSDEDTTATGGNPETRLNLERRRAGDLDVSASDIATTAEIVVAGLHVTDFTDAGHRYDVNLRALPQFRQSQSDLSLFTVPSTKSGLNAVPLDQVVSFTNDTTTTTVNRYDRSRSVTISVNVAPGGSQQAIQTAVTTQFQALHLGPQYTGRFGGNSKELSDALSSFAVAMGLAFVFVYLILVALFESWLYPVTILISLPLCVPFALLSIIVTGGSLNLYSMLGVLVLFGVVKKNSILQVDHANELRTRGLGREEAVLEAGRDRLRPILMTTLAFVAGMAPLALATGVGATTDRSAGDVIIGGQTLSLLLTLVATPVFYTILDDFSISVMRNQKRFLSAMDLSSSRVTEFWKRLLGRRKKSAVTTKS